MAGLELSSILKTRKTSVSRLAQALAFCFGFFGALHLGTGLVAGAEEPVPHWQIDGFKAALLDPDPNVVRAAILYREAGRILAAMGAAAKDQAPILIERLGDENSNVRAAAARALGVMGAAVKEVATLVAGRLGDEDRNVRAAAAQALKAMGAAAKDQVPLVAGRLGDEDSDVRRAAVQALKAMGAAAKEVAPLLAGRLGDGDRNVRRAAAQALGAMGAAVKEVATLVAGRLGDEDRNVRIAAAQALKAMGAAAKDQAPLLAERLGDEKWDVRAAAVKALGVMGAAAKEVAPLVAERLGDEDSDVRRAAVQALKAMGAAAKGQAPLLAGRLGDGDRNVRIAAAQALGAMGAAAKDQAPLLAERLGDGDRDVHNTAARALKAMGAAAKEVAPLLAGRLGDGDRYVRTAAAQALGAIGAAAKDQAPLLAGRLGDEDRDVRAAAVQALGAMGAAAKDQAPLLAGRLRDEDRIVRGAAAQALGAIGAAAKDQAPLLAGRLGDWDGGVRRAAAQALGAIGQAAKEVAPLVAGRLDDEDPNVRIAAAQALKAMGAAAKDQAPLVAGRLGDEDPNVRAAAAQALKAMGAAAKDQAPLVAGRLGDEDPNVRAAAAQALGVMGAAAKEVAPLVAGRLGDEDRNVRATAVQALKAMGAAAKEVAPLVAGRLGDEDSDVRRAAVQALKAMGAAAKEVAPLLAGRLGDEDRNVRRAAAQALKAMGAAAKDQAPLLAGRLGDEDRNVRIAAVQALGAMGAAAKDQAPLLAEWFGNESSGSGSREVQILARLGPFDVGSIPAILTPGYRNSSRRAEMRFLAHFLTGGRERAEVVLAWLGAQNGDPVPAAKENRDYARQVLELFEELWPSTEGFEGVRKNLAEAIEILVRNVTWGVGDIPRLENHRDNINPISSAYALSIEQAILATRGLDWARWALRAAALHGAFWITLIFAYPKFRPVQAIFFWNPWVRRVAGFGYVGLLLAWLPFLRRRLLAPFRDSLLADARLKEFRDADYFPASDVVEQRTKSRSPVTSALAEINGQIVLEGDSGLGKTMFLRHLAKNTKRLAVILDAKRCHNGVIEAIQEKLEGLARDPKYLRNIIFAGAIDVIIDGLNEVSAETRAGIAHFAERFSKGNLMITTQPMQWSPPPLATIYLLRPLRDDQIEAFLTTRASGRSEDAKVTGEAFAGRCRDFLRGALGAEVPHGEREEYRRTLSNPMDLSVVAQMLAHDRTPNLLDLQAQHYRVMADDYKAHNQGHDFPLQAFSDRVYEMRCDDETAFAADEFQDELVAMAAHRMVIPRQTAIREAEAMPLWTFRHDKVMDYFLVQAFLGKDNPRAAEHLGDARFRGTYLLMASLMPLDDAEELRERFINHAVDTKDHSISDSFIELLRTRTAA